MVDSSSMLVLVSVLVVCFCLHLNNKNIYVESFSIQHNTNININVNNNNINNRRIYGFHNKQLHQRILSTTASTISQRHPTTKVTAATITAAGNNVNGYSTTSSNSNSNSNSNTNLRLNVNQKARTVTSVCTSGTLCTVSYEQGIAGAPFGSFVDYVLDDDGCPILLMNDMSMHTINIQNAMKDTGNDNDSSTNDGTDSEKKGAMVTLFTQLGGGGSSAAVTSNSVTNNKLQDVSRCSITGILSKMVPTDIQMDSIRMKYSLTHSYADQVMDSPKFAFYRLQPKKIYFVGGFGVLAKWVDPIDYKLATPDILAKYATDITERINRDHVDDLQYVGKYLLKVDSTIEIIRVTNVDRLGMDVRVTSQQGTRRNKKQTDEFRIGFRIPVQSVEDAKSEILKIFQDAWEYGNGYTWTANNNNNNSTINGSTTNNDDDDETMIPVLKIAADSLE